MLLVSRVRGKLEIIIESNLLYMSAYLAPLVLYEHVKVNAYLIIITVCACSHFNTLAFGARMTLGSLLNAVKQVHPAALTVHHGPARGLPSAV